MCSFQITLQVTSEICSFKFCVKMLSDKEKENIKDFLQLLPDIELKSLAMTITQNIIKFETAQGNCDD